MMQSEHDASRASANATSVPPADCTTLGIRKHLTRVPSTSIAPSNTVAVWASGVRVSAASRMSAVQREITTQKHPQQQQQTRFLYAQQQRQTRLLQRRPPRSRVGDMEMSLLLAFDLSGTRSMESGANDGMHRSDEAGELVCEGGERLVCLRVTR